MYSKSAWGGPVDPFILVKFTGVGKDEGKRPPLSQVALGTPRPKQSTHILVCREAAADPQIVAPQRLAQPRLSSRVASADVLPFRYGHMTDSRLCTIGGAG